MIDFLKKYESYFFLLVVVSFCAPIVLSFRFITLDGPAHLYNSHVIYQLLFSEESLVKDFFSFTNFPNPNYFYHALGALLFIFFDDILIEKIIAVLYVFIFCYGFRKIVSNMDSTISFSYLIFPFVYSFTFLIGFYNFSFAIAIMFWFVALVSKQNFYFSIKNVVLVFFIYSALYFSHLMVFLVAIFIAVGFLCIDYIKEKNTKQIRFYILLPSLPFVFLAIWFVFSRTSHDLPQYLGYHELKYWLIEGRDIISRDYTSELFWAKSINYLLLSLLFVNSFLFFRNAILKKKTKLILHRGLFFYCLSFACLILLFLVPNNLISGSYLSVRLLLFFHLFVLLFFVFVSEKKNRLNKIVIFIIFVLSLKLLTVYTKQSIDLGVELKEYAQINNYLKNNSIVLPIDYSTNWLNSSNYGCYLGSSKKIVVLDNYEAATIHFPLTWRDKNLIPQKHMPDYGTNYNPRLNILDYEKKAKVRIDYVVRWKYAEANKNDYNNNYTDSILKKHFVKIFESTGKKAELFKHKN